MAHPAPLQPGDRGQLRLAGPLHSVHQLLLLLLRGRRLRPVLPQVQHLLPLHRQAVHQRQRVGQTAGREGRDRRSPRWTTGSPSCDDVPAVQAICDSLGPDHIDALLRKWLPILPNPFAPADEAAGYRYELSILQAEFSLTQMLDRPVSGRIFFEQVLHDNLDIGRPDQVSLIFDRRIIRTGRSQTPGRFRTRVITDGVIPSLHIDYKNTKIKQYHKEGQGAAHRDHDQRPPRLRAVQTADQPARPAADRLHRQPAPARRPTPPATTRSAALKRSPTSPRRSSPTPAPASPDCASATPASTPCCRPCSSTGCYPTDSPTVTCAP